MHPLPVPGERPDHTGHPGPGQPLGQPGPGLPGTAQPGSVQPSPGQPETAPPTGQQPELGLSPRSRRTDRADSFWAVVGGEPTFRKIVARFYELVAEDDLLRPMYPEEDLGPAEDRLRMFLEQYWGGPNTYSAQRGHPRLRIRHAPFAVTPTARDQWLAHMRVAVQEADLAPRHEATLWDYLERAAHFMVNTHQEDGS